MTRILCISDTHGKHAAFTDQIRSVEADVLVHAGDCTSVGTSMELIGFVDWLHSFTHIKHKVFIAGNHDFCLENAGAATNRVVTRHSDVHYLNNSGITLDGVQYWGSPWTPYFYGWAFNYRRGEAAEALWEQIPENTDVLITHGPSWNVLDHVRDHQVGCQELTTRISQLNLKLHVCGHIHEGYGSTQFAARKKTMSVNASLLDAHYHAVNKPILITL